MRYELWVILAYLLVLFGFNFWRSFKIKSQEDFMVAGRSLSMPVLVFTLVCTWIGSGTFIAGAEFAHDAGFSALWMAAGAWVGIIIIYFLAARIRTFGQYTIGDILEARYGKFARLFGAIALIISFTAIVSYQFRAGGLILNVITEGSVPVFWGQIIAAAFVIMFTAMAGMMAVAHTDLFNGIIIVLACVIAVPFVVSSAGGLDTAMQVLPAGHFDVVNDTFGSHPWLKAGSYFLATMLLLLGVQSMYQKFYAARTPKAAKNAVAWWVLGTIVVETVVVVIAVFATVRFYNTGVDPATMVLQAAFHMVPPLVGMLLLGAACVVVISTAMNYLLSPTTNIMRDMYQSFINPNASEKTMVAMQKVMVVLLGLVALFVGIRLTSVLGMAYFAYTIYGVAITPALLAALTWKRATKAGGLASILLGTFSCLALKMFSAFGPEHLNPEGDPFGIPLIYPSFIVSVLALVIVSYMTPAPSQETLDKVFNPKPQEQGG